MDNFRPKILVYSSTTADTIQSSLGEPEYSYYFVLKSYLPVLRKLGSVQLISDPATEVDPIYLDCKRRGRHCIFLAFCQPNQLNLELRCPTIPVFAWEFENIPNEMWDNDIQTDWRYTLARTGWAITHSSHTVRNVQRNVRSGFPVVSAPAPVWDRYASLSGALRGTKIDRAFTLEVEDGHLLDSRALDLDLFSPSNRSELHIPAPVQQATGIEISGVVYTSILNPRDGRKNWMDVIWAFCWAHKDQADATLVLKLTCSDPEQIVDSLLHDLYKLTPFSCRVVAVTGYLADSAYEQLAVNTTYAVNASRGEGQCLPLMEYMSCGVPAISPRHTGLLDYINDGNAFIVASSLEPTHWPHDPRQYYRTMRHRIEWKSLVDAYRNSYNTIVEDPGKYKKMSRSAIKNLKNHCSQKVVQRTLSRFFEDQKMVFNLYAAEGERGTHWLSKWFRRRGG
jgi:glycosyltransferase involved in cell wall biosynthesis